MINNSKRKLLFTTSILTLLLISSTYATLIPNAQAAEITIQQKATAVMKDIVGLDLTQYNISAKENSQILPFLGNVLQESVSFNLASADNNLKALYTYANGNLQGMFVIENEGTPSLTKTISGNDVEKAQDFLNDYQSFTAKSIFGELSSTLLNVDAGKNLTKSLGDKVLQVTAYEDGTHFKWCYTANGATAQYTKVVAVSFKDGFLTYFIDNWSLYSIGSASVNLSKGEAVAIALDAARKHNWTMQLDEDALDPII